MNLESYEFSASEIEQLNAYRDAQSDHRLQKRFLALLMLSKKIKVHEITDILGISRYSLHNWFKNYIKKGIDSLNSFQYKAKQSYLSDAQCQELKSWVKKKALEIEK